MWQVKQRLWLHDTMDTVIVDSQPSHVTSSMTSQLGHVQQQHPAASDLEERFDKLAGSIFQRCSTYAEDDDEEFSGAPLYPIAEQQQKRKLEQQLSGG